MSDKRLITFDPNQRARGDRCYAYVRDKRGFNGVPPVAGEAILAWESEDDLVWDATVVGIGPGGFVYFAVQWSTGRKRPRE